MKINLNNLTPQMLDDELREFYKGNLPTKGSGYGRRLIALYGQQQFDKGEIFGEGGAYDMRGRDQGRQ